MLKSVKFLVVCASLLFAATQAEAFPGNAAPNDAPQAAAPASNNLTKGTVVETMNAGGYTYLCLESGGQKSWVAIRETPVKLGEEIEVANGAVMNNFTSKTLGRTFKAIIFSQGIVKR